MASRRLAVPVLALLLAACRVDQEIAEDPEVMVDTPETGLSGPPALAARNPGPVAEVSVASLDRSEDWHLAISQQVSIEARLLVISADGTEPELGAIRSALDFDGVPHDVFVATAEPALTADRLASGSHGAYQGILLTSASLAISGTSALSSSEWSVLASYEAGFGVRRAVLAAWPDPALGFGSYTTKNTGASPVGVTCTGSGKSVFRDVNCGATQLIGDGAAYLSTPTVGAPLTPLLTDSAGHALAAIHQGADGRQSLLLLFRNDPEFLHTLTFLHGVIGWVTGGTYLGERRIDLSAQVDDLFLSAPLYTGGTFRLDDGDLQAALAWVKTRRAQPRTRTFHLSFAFNGVGAATGDPLTDEIVAHSGEWYFINHTWAHHGLDSVTYDEAYDALSQNLELAGDLPLSGFDERDLVTPNVSGLLDQDAMAAAWDLGVRYAVTDTSMPGCDNPSPNTAFYNVMAPKILLIPRRATNLFWDVSTPSQWVADYNAHFRDDWGRDSTYAQLLDQESDVLVRHLMRGDSDPWMFHQADVRAYDGVHSLLGDLLDATLAKLDARLRVSVRTLPMHQIAQKFARRAKNDTSGIRATLFPGRALVIDAASTVNVPVTGVRPEDGQLYGGDVIRLVHVTKGTSACVPLDLAGDGCDPAPVREGGPGPAQKLPTGYCDASSLPTSGSAVARGSTWRYWDGGGNLGTAWRAPSFDDTAWASGAGPLGYGEDYLGTTVSYGPSAGSKYVTTYFRRTFTVDDPAAVTSMFAQLMYDDGFVAYLNGVEIARAAMPSGGITSSTLAIDHEASNAYDVFDWSAASGALIAGTNTIAVEVHQANASSSDLVFDLGLDAYTSGP